MTKDELLAEALTQMNFDTALSLVSAICGRWQIPMVLLAQQTPDGRMASVVEEVEGGGPALARLIITGFPSHMSEAIAAVVSDGAALHAASGAEEVSYEDAKKILANNAAPKKPNSWGLPSKRPN